MTALEAVAMQMRPNKPVVGPHPDLELCLRFTPKVQTGQDEEREKGRS